MSRLNIMIIPGLTLNDVTDDNLARIQSAAGSDAKIIVTNYKDAPAQAGNVDVILGIVPPQLFARAPKLRWVQSISSGVDSFMYPEFINSTVMLTSEKGLVGEHLADHGFGLLLTLTRQLAAARDLGPEAWHNRPELRAAEIELTGTTMGIIGFGGTGRAMAKRAQAFGMNCMAVDPDDVDVAFGVEQILPPSALPDMLAAADIIAVCAPLTDLTDKLINPTTLAQCKVGAFIINVTRGEIIDEQALIEALKSGHIRGAGLDVAPREPLPPDSELWRLPNVVMTPHTAGASQFRAQRNLDRFIQNVSRFARGEPLEGMIDKTLGY